MLKDILKLRTNKPKKGNSDQMPLKLKGRLSITAERNGEVIHYDEGHNVVTVWAKHATMHLLNGENYSTHGDIIDSDDGVTMRYSSRSIDPTEHVAGLNNIDGTVVSEQQYLGDNDDYYDTGLFQHKHFSKPSNLSPDTLIGDNPSTGFKFPFFPTKMLFGTGVEFTSWDEVILAGRDGAITDITSYMHPKNGGWTEADFNDLLNTNTDPTNYYSNVWDAVEKKLTPARTVNDVYSGVIAGSSPIETDFGIPGAIKDATYRGTGETGVKLEEVEGKQFAKESYRGIGKPAYIYVKRDRFMKEGAEVRLQVGTTPETLDLESKITYTTVLPEQPTGEFNPYNGYTLKMAGLFCDARMLLGNFVPENDYPSAPSETDLTGNEYSNYKKMPGGIMFAKRKIAPIYKSHDVKITAQWTIYLP